MASSLVQSLARITLKNSTNKIIPLTTTTTTSKTSHVRVALFSTTDSKTSTSQQLDRRSIYNYHEEVSKMTNEELINPSTIPGFSTLIHSPPRSSTSTPRNALVGTVVSDKMDKTVNVLVDRYKIVPKYKKRMKYSRKFMAHDEKEVCGIGDLVMIVPCQKISKMKHFRVHEIIRSNAILS